MCIIVVAPIIQNPLTQKSALLYLKRDTVSRLPALQDRHGSILAAAVVVVDRLAQLRFGSGGATSGQCRRRFRAVLRRECGTRNLIGRDRVLPHLVSVVAPSSRSGLDRKNSSLSCSLCESTNSGCLATGHPPIPENRTAHVLRRRRVPSSGSFRWRDDIALSFARNAKERRSRVNGTIRSGMRRRCGRSRRRSSAWTGCCSG